MFTQSPVFLPVEVLLIQKVSQELFFKSNLQTRFTLSITAASTNTHSSEMMRVGMWVSLAGRHWMATAQRCPAELAGRWISWSAF